MSKVTQMKMSADPLFLIKFILDQYAEQQEGKDTKAIQFARYDYLSEINDDKIESLVNQYAADRNLSEINIMDLKDDVEAIFEYIYETKEYKKIELKYNKMGYGTTGKGVVDKSDNTFYDCKLAEHWSKIKDIIEDKHPQMEEVFNQMESNKDMEECNGITRKELDEFILNNFELIGSDKSI